MNKKNIVEYVIGRTSKENPDDKLIYEIEYALLEMEAARNTFNNVEDPRLIEASIFSEHVAMNRLDRLYSEAKARGISVSENYLRNRYLEIAE